MEAENKDVPFKGFDEDVIARKCSKISMLLVEKQIVGPIKSIEVFTKVKEIFTPDELAWTTMTHIVAKTAEALEGSPVLQSLLGLLDEEDE